MNRNKSKVCLATLNRLDAERNVVDIGPSPQTCADSYKQREPPINGKNLLSNGDVCIVYGGMLNEGCGV